MPSNTAIPFFRIGDNLTGKVTGGDVTGKKFVQYAAGGRAGQPNIKPAAAKSRPAGVAGHDQVVGGYVHFLHAGVVPVTATADILADAQVQISADGGVETFTDGYIVGTCIAGVSAGAEAPIHLKL
jgi:hypothetical protein